MRVSSRSSGKASSICIEMLSNPEIRVANSYKNRTILDVFNRCFYTRAKNVVLRLTRHDFESRGVGPIAVLWADITPVSKNVQLTMNGSALSRNWR